MQIDEIKHGIAGYKGYLKHGHTYRLKQKMFYDFVWTKEKTECNQNKEREQDEREM